MSADRWPVVSTDLGAALKLRMELPEEIDAFTNGSQGEHFEVIH